ncbi:MAG: HAD family hydrolase [Candidatus Cryptobacteroides sp.]
MEYIALFDLDGVILDTETDYTSFWNGVGKEYGKGDGFGISIKGQTLVKILQEHFPNEADKESITESVMEYERHMRYDYIPGALQFIDALRSEGIRTAIVTSSDHSKMANVCMRHPDFNSRFDHILTSEDFTQSKPSPECYIKGMAALGADPSHTVVFEDSVSGLRSGRDSGAVVVGLTTTNPADVVAEYADFVIADFVGHSFREFIK